MTVSCVKPLLHHLFAQVCLPKEEDTQLTEDIKKAVMTYMQIKYKESDANKLLSLVTVLDAQFKMTYIEEDIQ